MNEDFIRNFWLSQEKPKSLPDGWTWIKDMENILTLLEAYEVLYPDKDKSYLPHYICAPIKMKDSILYWYEYCIIEENFILIWRPSICDPEVTESNILFGGIFEETFDEQEDEDEEDEEDF